MTKQIQKAVIRGSLPYEGFRGVIFFEDGSHEKVMNKVLVEPYELHGAFQWDYYPFDTKAEAEKATRRRISQLKAKH